MYTKPRTIPIRFIIFIIFIILLLITIGSIGYIVFSNWLSSTDHLARQISESQSQEIVQKIENFISISKDNNLFNQELLSNNLIDLENEIEREKFFVGVLQNQIEEIYSFSFGTENGEYYGARRNEKGEIEIMRNNSSTGGHSWYYSVSDSMIAEELVTQLNLFDPRSRDWYIIAKNSRQPSFSPIYKHFVMDDLTVSASYPIYDQEGELLGVLGTHVILSKLNSYLEEIVNAHNGLAVIIEKDTEFLLANTLGIKNYATLEDSTFSRFTLTETKNMAITNAYDHYRLTNENLFKINSGRDGYFISIEEYQDNGLDWVIITAIPEDLFLSGIIKNLRSAIILTLLALLVSTISYILLTQKYLLKPIEKILTATTKLSSGDLTQRITINRNDELGKISLVFNKMAKTIYSLVHDLEERIENRTQELQTTNKLLQENKDHLQLILNSTAEAIYGIDILGNCTFSNNSNLKILGYSGQDELIGKNMHQLIHHSYHDGSVFPVENCKILESIKKGEGIRAEDEVFWKADGTYFDVAYNAYPQLKNGEVVGAVITFMDITERKLTQKKIEYLNNHDPLTGLYNRRYFEKLLKIHNTKIHLPSTIIFGDVNGLKLTNDVFGHSIGDELLEKIAETLKDVCRDTDFVARVGGDEFVMFLPITNSKDAAIMATRIKKDLSKKQVSAIKCEMSIGHATRSNMQQSLESTLKKAEDEMYKQKTLNRKKYQSGMLKTIITSLHKKSPREKQHSLKVSNLSQKIGLALGLLDTEINQLKEAGYYHDIGKVRLDDSILNKSEKFNVFERKKMELHPVLGYRIMNLFDDKLNLAEGIYSHHENWDGSGYPKGLKGKEIPLIGRILAVAEYFVSLKTYKNINEEEAIQVIKKFSGSKFDPQIIDALSEIILINENKSPNN